MVVPLLQWPALAVPEKYMAQIGPLPAAKAGERAFVDAIFCELPTDVTAALVKKCVAYLPQHNMIVMYHNILHATILHACIRCV